MSKTVDYKFPVELFPLKADNTEIPNKFAVIRTDSHKALAVVSEKYSIVKHENVIDNMHAALKGSDFAENIELTKDGAQLFATYTMKSKTLQAEVAKGDIVGMQLTVKNSYDGSSPVQLSLGAIRLICTNGMTLSKKFMGFSQRHIGEVDALNLDEVKEKITLYAVQFGELVPVMNKMTKVTSVFLEKDFKTETTKLPAYLLKEAYSEFQSSSDKSVWGYYNSLTYAITHKLRKESPAHRAYYSDLAWRIASSKIA